jgi:hypothetical protein
MNRIFWISLWFSVFGVVASLKMVTVVLCWRNAKVSRDDSECMAVVRLHDDLLALFGRRVDHAKHCTALECETSMRRPTQQLCIDDPDSRTGNALKRRFPFRRPCVVSSAMPTDYIFVISDVVLSNSIGGRPRVSLLFVRCVAQAHVLPLDTGSADWCDDRTLCIGRSRQR